MVVASLDRAVGFLLPSSFITAASLKNPLWSLWCWGCARKALRGAAIGLRRWNSAERTGFRVVEQEPRWYNSTLTVGSWGLRHRIYYARREGVTVQLVFSQSEVGSWLGIENRERWESTRRTKTMVKQV